MHFLSTWAAKNDIVVGRHAHARTVANDVPNRSDLFRFEDYYVSAVSGGTIWLIRRHEFSTTERTIRGNIRNACVGQTVRELELWKDDHPNGFSRDCIEEYLMEVRLED